jgi:hypothetical protein
MPIGRGGIMEFRIRVLGRLRVCYGGPAELWWAGMPVDSGIDAQFWLGRFAHDIIAVNHGFGFMAKALHS